MKRILIFILFFLIVMLSSTNIEARICNPEIEICEVIDPGGPACQYSTSDHTMLSLNFEVNCTIENSSDVDIFEIYVGSISDILIYTEGLQVYLNGNIYIEPDLTNEVYSKDNEDLEGAALNYTSPNNIFAEFNSTASTKFIIEIYPNGNETGAYSISVNTCDCVNDEFYYIRDTYNSPGVVTSSVEQGHIYYKSELSNYSTALSNAVNMWNDLGVISIEDVDQMEVPPGEEPEAHLVFTDYYDSSPEHVIAYYDNNPTEKDYIVINTFVFDRLGFNEPEETKTLAHEISHALGITMDIVKAIGPTDRALLYSSNWYSYPNTQLSFHEIYFGVIDKRNWEDIVNDEESFNVSQQGENDLYALGPCDKAIYRYLWGWN